MTLEIICTWIVIWFKISIYMLDLYHIYLLIKIFIRLSMNVETTVEEEE